jgi:hypothetical protein
VSHIISYDVIKHLRAPVCPDPSCGECPCHAELCDRGCDRHAAHVVTLPSGKSRMVCSKCVEPVECSNGCKAPRWMTDVLEGDRFCADCQGRGAGESW